MATARQLKEIQHRQFIDNEIKEIQNILRFMLFGTKKDGYIKIFNDIDYYNNYKYEQKMFTVKQLLTFEVLKEILNNSQFEPVNLFYSVNTYKEIKSACEDNLGAITNILIDIDYKKSFFKKLSKDEFRGMLEYEYFGQVIPCPSMLIYTGNNFHIIYKMKYPVNATQKAKTLAKRIQKEFTKKLNDLNADKSVNLTTSTRFVNTYNSKTMGIATSKIYKNKTYELRELQNYLPEKPSWYDEWAEKKKKNKGKKKVVNFYNIYNLLETRIKDLEKIQELRNFSCHGHRELMCFLYRNFTMQSLLIGDNPNDASIEAERKMLEFNNRFTRPLIEKRIESKTRNVERKQYNFKNDTIITMLNIKAIEERELKTIISGEEKERRDKICKKKYDEQRKEERKKARRNEKGLTKREQEKQDKINRVKELKKQGLSNIKIAEKLGINKSTIGRLLKA